MTFWATSIKFSKKKILYQNYALMEKLKLALGKQIRWESISSASTKKKKKKKKKSQDFLQNF